MVLKKLLTLLQSLPGLLTTRAEGAELSQMTTRELNDLGIGRGDIPALLNQPAAWSKDRC
ncbi:MAG: DUF1127 domain-containing protein [Pseudomonadota bacterium]